MFLFSPLGAPGALAVEPIRSTPATTQGKVEASRLTEPARHEPPALHHPPTLLPRLRSRRRQDRPGLVARRAGLEGPRGIAGKAAPFRPEGEAGHLHVHGRGTEPARPVRPEADADEARRAAR